MNKIKQLILIASALGFAGCATAPPKELVNARAAYERASTGPAAQVAPAELHVASEALATAERSFLTDPESYQCKDLAYVAHRKAQLAEATASISIEQEKQIQASKDYQVTQGQIVTQTKQDLSQTQSALADSQRSVSQTQSALAESQRSGKLTAQELAAEQAARAAADERAAAAVAALAKLSMVKEEPRGMVITLSGSVLFASNQTTLLPAARARLDQVADVLLASKERTITIEGHTDSQGSDNHNMTLSQGRADAVRAYIIQRGYQGDLIQSHGLGEGQPVAANTNAEGRANNRRVEIIVAKDNSSTSAQK